MAKLTKQSFQYFKGMSELKCGWTVDVAIITKR